MCWPAVAAAIPLSSPQPGATGSSDWGQGDRLIVNSKALGQPDLSLADLRDAATVTEAGLVMALGTHSLTLTGS